MLPTQIAAILTKTCLDGLADQVARHNVEVGGRGEESGGVTGNGGKGDPSQGGDRGQETSLT